MELNTAFGMIFRSIRLQSHFTQEDFATVSGRTYISNLERGVHSPTIDKVDDLASVFGPHPLTLLVCSYALKDGIPPETLLARVTQEIEQFGLVRLDLGAKSTKTPAK